MPETKKKTTKKIDMSWWKAHCKWLDTFRGKIITKEEDEIWKKKKKK